MQPVAVWTCLCNGAHIRNDDQDGNFALRQDAEPALPGWQLHQLDFPTFRMGLLAKLVDRHTIRQLAELFDLTYAQWRVVARLGNAPDGATVGQIAEQAWVDRAEVSRAGSLLESRNLLERRENPSDRRAPILCLTSDGMLLYDRVIKVRASFHRQLTSGLSPDDITILDNLIDKIRVTLETTSRIP